MNINEWFGNDFVAPPPLTKQELYDLFEKLNFGDEKAKEKIVVHNIRLVLYVIANRFDSIDYDKKDLVSTGLVGLMKAVNTFDLSKNMEFSTYAVRCINNEILNFLRDFNKNITTESIECIVYTENNGKELTLKDMLSDETDIAEEYNTNETYHIIRELVNNLPERDKKIAILYFGFNNNKTYTQEEIASILALSQTYISKLIKNIVNRIKVQLIARGVIELKAEIGNYSLNKVREK